MHGGDLKGTSEQPLLAEILRYRHIYIYICLSDPKSLDHSLETENLRLHRNKLYPLPLCFVDAASGSARARTRVSPIISLG